MKKRAARKPDRRADRKPKPGGRRATSAGGLKAPAGGESRAAGRAKRKTAISRARTRRPANGAPIDGPEEILDPAAFAEETSEDAIAEAVEIDLLLDEDDPGEPAEIEDDYFFKAPPRNPSLPRARPAPEIVKRRRAPAAGDEAEPATVPDHLFARNLKYRYPVAVRAKGVWIHDSDGRDYLDACSGAVVCSIGHGVEEVAAVMTRQAKRLAFAHSSQFITRESTDLAARIAALAPGDMKRNGRVYLVSGGSEAVETAIKLARQYHVETGHPSKTKIVARWQSYHGSTLGALAATGNVARRALYTPLLAAMPHIPPCYCYRCPYGQTFPSCGIACVEDLEATILQEGPENVAAFIAEPIVGATLGAAPAVDGYWARAREICSHYNVLLIADEVMTGIGRTGRNFAVDHHRVVPDLLVTGKGLSGGYTPLGAVIADAAVHEAIRAGRGYFEHGFTYSANPLSAAVGSAVLDYIDKHRLIARAARVGRILGKKLAGLMRHRIVGEVRGRGMLWGIELVRNRRSREPFDPALKVSRRIYQAGLEEGILLYPGSGSRQGQDGDHFIVAPPFTITAAELDELMTRLDRVLKKTAASLR